jgi:hypothetical protein
MADPNQYNVGETIIWGASFTRYTTATPATEVALNMTTCSVAVTDPSGATTTTNIGSMRNPATGRYESDTVATAPGRWTAKWTGDTTYTDEQSVARTYKQIETDFADVVSP